jgi:hypothetical protein
LNETPPEEILDACKKESQQVWKKEIERLSPERERDSILQVKIGLRM